jgi:hypothetical protein
VDGVLLEEKYRTFPQLGEMLRLTDDELMLSNLVQLNKQ